MARQRYRKASEIGEFLYCHHAWWLHQVEGRQPGNQAALAAGREHHAQHGALVRRAVWLRRLAVVAGIAALILLVFGWWFA